MFNAHVYYTLSHSYFGQANQIHNKHWHIPDTALKVERWFLFFFFFSFGPKQSGNHWPMSRALLTVPKNKIRTSHLGCSVLEGMWGNSNNGWTWAALFWSDEPKHSTSSQHSQWEERCGRCHDNRRGGWRGILMDALEKCWNAFETRGIPSSSDVSRKKNHGCCSCCYMWRLQEKTGI